MERKLDILINKNIIIGVIWIRFLIPIICFEYQKFFCFTGIIYCFAVGLGVRPYLFDRRGMFVFHNKDILDEKCLFE